MHQHCDGHGANTAGYRGYSRAKGLNVLIVNVAAKLAVFVTVHTDVDNNGTLFNHIGGDKFCTSDGGNKYVSLTAELFKILRFGVADGHGGVSVKHQHCHRLADDIASTDDNTVLADTAHGCELACQRSDIVSDLYEGDLDRFLVVCICAIGEKSLFSVKFSGPFDELAN